MSQIQILADVIKSLQKVQSMFALNGVINTDEIAKAIDQLKSIA